MKTFVRLVHFFKSRFYYDWCHEYYYNYYGKDFKNKRECKGWTAGMMQDKKYKCFSCPYNKRYNKKKHNADIRYF